MTFLKSLFISTVALTTLIGAAATPPALSDINQLSFVNMQNDSTISISYTSSGCFHHETGVLKFTPETVSYGGETKTVTFEDMASLDKYFQSLSAKQDEPGGCTTSTDMTLTLNRDNQVVGKMALHDGFCFMGEDMLSPQDLKYKLFMKEKAEQQTLIEK